MKKQEMITKLNELYGISDEPTRIFFSPGRVNLIGEHTDYNGGYVFPCALDFGTWLAARKNNLNTWRFATLNFETRGELKVAKDLQKIEKFWYNYPLGVIDQIQKAGKKPTGCDFLFYGEIPNGAGLSSSASVETVTAYALNEIFGFGMERMELVKLSQKAENQFVGVNCGIMDQFAVCMGKENHAMFLNCATLEYQHVPLKMDGFKLIISNTNKRRGLADSKYNERRGECELAVKLLSKNEAFNDLSEVGLNRFMEIRNLIPDEVVFRRAKHVLSENQRVLDAIEALTANDLVKFGQLMNASHDSLRDDYEVTGTELDTLVEEARKTPGVLGSRMTGAGFGGCTVSLVKEDSVDQFKTSVAKGYEARTGLKPEFYIGSPGEGTHEI